MNKVKIAKYVIDINASLLDALKQMDKTDCKLLLVFKNERYFNIISIGDVQRSILAKGNVNIPISDALRKIVKVGRVGQSLDYHKKMMVEFRMFFLPIVNEQNELLDVLFWDELFNEKDLASNNNNNDYLNLPLVIMAGGEGTRLYPITKVIPKPLVPLGDKPIIENIIDSFVCHGINQVFVSVNYKADLLKFHFDSLPKKQYDIHYFMEDKPLGTAGSLKLLKGIINGTFVVSNCDIYIQDDYSEILKYHKENKNELTAVAAVKSISIPYGTMEMGENGKLIALHEKPEFSYYVNAGLYILESHLLNEIPDNTFFHITELMEKINQRNGKVGVFPVSEQSWLDIGNWQEYQKSQKLFKS
jgi:dTDP-glucose pyrophosphorylase